MSCPPPPDSKPYRRRPLPVTAFRWDGGEVEGFGRVYAGRDNDGNVTYSLVVAPLEGLPTYARAGDWVVTEGGVDAVVADADFARSYEPAADPA